MRRKPFVLGLAFALAAWPAFSIDGSFKAFGTLGAMGTDTDRLAFRRDYIQNAGATSNWGADIDSRLGLQVDADFSREFHAGVQWVARNQGGDFFEQGLDWAYLRWRPRDDWDLRLGRLGFDAFLLSDYRNVGYAYPWMRPPAEFYSLFSPHHFDGGDIAKKFTLDGGYLTLKAYTGQALVAVTEQDGTLDNDRILLFGGNVVYETGDWRFRVGYAQIQIKNNLPQQQAVFATLSDPQVQAVWPAAGSIIDTMTLKNKPLHYASLGLAYDDGIWLAQAEAVYNDSSLEASPSKAAGYLSLGRRVGHVTAYSLLGIVESFNRRVDVPAPLLPVPELLALRAGIIDGLNTNGTDQMSASLGGRWDIHENVAVKAQWSHMWLGGNGIALWLNPQPPLPNQVNIWSFGVDFVY